MTRATLRRGSRVADNVLGLAGNVGSSVAKHANMTVRNVVRGRKNRKSKKTRKSRR